MSAYWHADIENGFNEKLLVYRLSRTKMLILYSDNMVEKNNGLRHCKDIS
jgi:hypothetical protein